LVSLCCWRPCFFLAFFPGVPAIHGIPACFFSAIPDVPCVPAAAGIPAVCWNLDVAGLPAVARIPHVCWNLAVAGVSAVTSIPAACWNLLLLAFLQSLAFLLFAVI
jgi:hypothetical protein